MRIDFFFLVQKRAKAQRERKLRN